MTRNNLTEGILLTLAGIGCMIAAVFTETVLDGILWGITGAALALGVGTIAKYYYWSSPKRAERYQELQEQKDIELRDELNEKLRDRSGRIAYTISLMVICVSMVVFSILGKVGLVAGYRVFVLYLGGLLAFLIVLGIAIYRRLSAIYR